MIAKEKLAKIAGSTNVSDDAATLDAYSTDVSFVNTMRPACVVRPRNAGEVKELVAVANETLTPLVPVSSGPPHFKGDTVPSTGGAVVVDLSGMKKIVFVDRPRRVTMVEPGVTFGELIPAAEKEGIRLNMPLLPKATKSVVGSLLDREPVLMPKYQWDISDPVACFEVIFGTGDDFRTGQAAGPGTVEEQWKVGGVQKAPYGPHIATWHRLVQGAQGTMGIVTWASLRCELLPELEEPYLVGSSRLEPLLDMAAWLIRLRMVNECFILSNADMAAMFAQDWPADFNRLRADLPQWNLFYVVAGYKYFPEERVSGYVGDIGALAQRLGIEPARSAGGLSARDILKAVKRPSTEPYWKLRYKGASEDVFFLTINDKIEGLVATMQALAGKAGYPASDMGVYIQPIVQGNGCHCEFNLFYDPANRREAEQVRDLSRQAVKALMDGGAFFSRPYGESTAAIMNRDAATVTMLRKLKKVFDPNDLMNPGKLCF
ncbi:MAG: FAD-binding oxidoreductase [Thermoleophilia bacterium]|nr:FAD-binding oxidoreductase [Thermoleophilia bacterium]